MIIIKVILGLVLIFCIKEIISSKYFLEVTYYNIESQKSTPKYGLYRFLTFMIVNLGICQLNYIVLKICFRYWQQKFSMRKFRRKYILSHF